MAERRMLWNKVSRSRKVNSLSDRAAILWVFSIPWFDCEGYMEADPEFIKDNVVPKRKNILEEDIPALVDEIVAAKLWQKYVTRDGKIVAYDPMFKVLQIIRPDREAKSRFKDRLLQEDSGITPGPLQEHSGEIRKERSLKKERRGLPEIANCGIVDKSSKPDSPTALKKIGEILKNLEKKLQ